MAGIPRRLSALALASTLILCSDVIDWLTEQHESPATKETLQPEALVVLMVARLVVGQQVFIMCLVHDAGPDVLGHTRLERVSEPSPCHYHITLLSPPRVYQCGAGTLSGAPVVGADPGSALA